MAPIDRNAPQQPKKRIQEWFVIKFPLDDVTDWTRGSELKQDGIDPGDVVGQKKKSALRQIVESECIDSIKATRQQTAKKIDRAFSAGHGRHRLSFTINVWTSAIGNWRWKAA